MEPQDSGPDADSAATPGKLPDWAKSDVATEVPTSLALTPSAIPAHGDDVTSQLPEQELAPPLEQADSSRFLRGNIIHALLQYLPDVPPEQWEARARAYTDERGVALEADRTDEIVKETLAILRRDDFTPLFGPGSQAEVPIIARLMRKDGPPIDLNGQIDRLVVLDDEVLIVDYKTNRPPPSAEKDVAPLYLRQLAAYRTALSMVYPEKRVRAALLWTDGPTLMEIGDDLLDPAAADLGAA